MATLYELKRRRLLALRAARRIEREADSAIERIERRMFTLLNRKTIIDQEAALTMVPLWNDFRKKVGVLERALADFISIVSV